VVLDHVGLFAPTMDRAAEALTRLGFRLTPLTPQRHRLVPGAPLVAAGTANRLALLRRGYIEILTAISDTPVAAQLRAAIRRYAGLHLIAFGTGDATASHASLAENGFAPQPLIELERTVDARTGEAVARFSVVRVAPGAMAEGRIQYCQHHTPELVWQARWLEQPNRAQALSDVLLCVDDPATAAARYGRFTGRAAQESGGNRLLELDRGRLVLTDRRGLARLLPHAAAPALPFMAAIAVTTDDLGASAAALRNGDIVCRQFGEMIIARFPADIDAWLCFVAAEVPPPWLG
jgi:hypothetical protein